MMKTNAKFQKPREKHQEVLLEVFLDQRLSFSP